MGKRLYPYLYVSTLIFLSGCAVLLFWLAGSQIVSLPLDFNTVYFAFRTIVAISFFIFFLLLMCRHLVLMLIAVADHIERYRQLGRDARRKEPPFQPLISIIVPAYNEGKCIEASIKSLLTIDYPRYEILVIDDGSSDDTLMRAKTMEGDYGQARVVVYWKQNGGKSTALNFGIQRAAGDFVTTIDSDSVIEPQSLAAVARHFEDPEVGAVAGAVKVVNTSSFWSRLQGLEYIKGLNLVRRAQGFLRAVSIVPGPIGTFRRAALEEAGYYDHDTFAEDCDLTLKLLMNGWKIIYEPEAAARTEAPEELMALIKQRYRWTRGVLQALRKHRRRMFLPRGASLTAIFMLWYMAFEGLFWPLMTTLSIAFMFFVGFDASVRPAAAYCWLQLVVLDAITGLYCIGVEESTILDTLLTPVERLVYQTLLEVGKFIASIEEFSGLKMSWGKLERKGLK
jgi:poly-beta-1,6-N-acetyl-D-glucosamine synthase